MAQRLLPSAGFAEADTIFSRSLAVLTGRLGGDHAYTIDVRSDYGFLLLRAALGERVARQIYVTRRGRRDDAVRA